eukprot:gene4717-9361_t
MGKKRPWVETRNVLLDIFPKAITLKAYLYLTLERFENVISANDSTEFIDLLTTTMILPDERSIQTILQVEPAIGIKIQDIINRFIAFNRYHSEGGMRGNVDVECHFVNSTHIFITTSAWQLLADRLGESVLRHILSRPVFMFLPNGSECYVQVSGTPLQELIHRSKLKLKLKSRPSPKNTTTIRDNSATATTTSTATTSSLPTSNNALRYEGGVGSKCVPRHKLFYIHRPRLPAHRIIKTMSTDSLLQLMFPCIQTSSYKISKHVSNNLNKLCQNILSRLSICDVVHALNLHCESITATMTMTKTKATTTSSSTIATPTVTRLVPSADTDTDLIIDRNTDMAASATSKTRTRKRKRKRGCRAGISARKKRHDRKIVTATTTEAAVGTTSSTGIRTGGVANTSKNTNTYISGIRHHDDDKKDEVAVHTVRDRLVQRAVSTANRAHRLSTGHNITITPIAIPTAIPTAATTAATTTTTMMTTMARRNVLPSPHMCLNTPVVIADEDNDNDGYGYVTQDEDLEDDDGDDDDDQRIPLPCGSQVKEQLQWEQWEQGWGQMVEGVDGDDTAAVLPRSGLALHLSLRNMPAESSSGSSAVVVSSSVDPNHSLETVTSTSTSIASVSIPHTSYDDHEQRPSCCCSPSPPSPPPLQLIANKHNHNNNHTDPDIKILRHITSTTTALTSASTFSSNSTTIPTTLPLASESALLSEDFLSLSCPHNRVIAFIAAVCRRLLPDELVWGSRHNRNVFLSGLNSFVKLGRGESLTVATLCNRMKTSDIPWLKLNTNANTNTNKTKTNIIKSKKWKRNVPMHTPKTKTNKSTNEFIIVQLQSQQQSQKQSKSQSQSQQLLSQSLLFDFMLWLYTDVIIGVLSRAFYVTEGEGRAKETLYYLRSVWDGIVTKAGNRINAQFVQLKIGNSGKLTDSMLMNVPHHCNMSERKLKLKLNGFGVNGLDEIYEKFRSYRLRNAMNNNINNNPLPSLSPLISTTNSNNNDNNNQSNNNNNMDDIHSGDEFSKETSNKSLNETGKEEAQEYYIAVLDLDKCFDNVDTARLYDLIQNLLLNNSNINNKHTHHINSTPDEGRLIQKYTVSSYIRSADRIVSRPLRKVAEEGDFISFSGK